MAAEYLTAELYLRQPKAAAEQSEYDGASSKINSIREQIEDEDFTTAMESELDDLLSTWTEYRKSLRSYISSGDGSKELPSPPKD